MKEKKQIECPIEFKEGAEYYEFKNIDEFGKCYEHGNEHYIESCYPLRDPELKGLEACSRVSYTTKQFLGEYREARVSFHKNRIIFRKIPTPENPEPEEGAVTCTHTAVCIIDEDEVNEFAHDLAEKSLSLENIPERFQPMKDKLKAVDHFYSLKSYVEALTELPIKEQMISSYESPEINPETLPFGFNSAMQSQIIRALKKAIPKERVKAIVKDAVIAIRESVPLEWFKSRLPLLNDIYNLYSIFCVDKDFEELKESLKLIPEMALQCAIGSDANPYLINEMFEKPEEFVEEKVIPTLLKKLIQYHGVVLSPDRTIEVVKEGDFTVVAEAARVSYTNEHVRKAIIEKFLELKPPHIAPVFESIAAGPYMWPELLLLTEHAARNDSITPNALYYLLRHPDTNEDILSLIKVVIGSTLTEDERRAYVYFALHPRAPVEALVEMAKSNNEKILSVLVTRKRVPLEVLHEIAMKKQFPELVEIAKLRVGEEPRTEPIVVRVYVERLFWENEEEPESDSELLHTETFDDYSDVADYISDEGGAFEVSGPDWETAWYSSDWSVDYNGLEKRWNFFIDNATAAELRMIYAYLTK